MTNTAPIAFDDDFIVQQGATSTAVTGNLRLGDGNGVDFDPDGNALGWSASPVSLDWAFFSNGELGWVQIVGGPYYPHPIIVHTTIINTAAGGRVVIETDGDFSYQSAAGFSGVDWFDYALVDDLFATDIGRVTINVLPTPGANNAPIAVDDFFAAAENQQISGNLLANNGSGADSDPDGNPLTVQNETIVTTKGGVVSIYANGDFAYTPQVNFHGTDTFTYTILDNLGAKDTATVTLDIASVNNAPIAKSDNFSATHGHAIAGNVMANNGNGADSDPDGDALQVVAASLVTVKGGSVSLLTDGSFVYSPAASFAGADGFTYTLVDGHGGSALGAVTLNMINHAPQAIFDSYTGTFNNAVSGNVLSNDSDSDGDPLSAAVQNTTTVKGGTVAIQANGAFTYTPAAGFIGSDSFTYTAKDGFGGASTGLVNVTYAAPSGSINGTSAGDTINGTAGNDNILAYGGDDLVFGKLGNDVVSGGEGKDSLGGDAGNDTLSGEGGKDQLDGGAGDDVLQGGLEADKLNGGAGADQLFGGAGVDELTGAAGADRFVLDGPNGTSADKVKDFVHGTDVLAVYGSDYGLAPGALPDASYFALAAGAADVAHGRFLYNATTMTLAWDADGHAATANATIATFSAGAVLGAGDFLIL